jgi:DNA-binding NtrC family response regulator
MPDVCILLVDRDPDIRLAFQRDVRALGWETRIATSPLQVVRCMMRDESSVRAALVSTGMGEANTRQVLSFLADDHPKVRRVVLAGRATVGLAENMITTRHADVMLLTPWTEGALVDLLGRAC